MNKKNPKFCCINSYTERERESEKTNYDNGCLLLFPICNFDLKIYLFGKLIRSYANNGGSNYLEKKFSLGFLCLIFSLLMI